MIVENSLPKEMKQKKLFDELENELDWRNKEFQIIKEHINNLKKQEDDKILSVVKKMSIPVVYAHWEGFSVTIFKYLLRYINEEKLRYNNVTNNLFTYAHKRTYDYLKGKQSFEQKCKFSKDFLDCLSSKFITLEPKIDTKCNLNYKNLEEVCEQLGINTEKLKQYEYELNTLVNIRNAIAHGENSYKLTEDQITKYMETVTSLMDTLYIEVVEFVKLRKYYIDNAV